MGAVASRALAEPADPVVAELAEAEVPNPTEPLVSTHIFPQRNRQAALDRLRIAGYSCGKRI
jgi:hypothetical protein